MGASQKYHARERHLYALLFASGKAYIGQTIDLCRRKREHARSWSEPFEMIQLGTMWGTQEQGEDHEYAWRYRAAMSGYTVLGKTWDGSIFVVRPLKRMNAKRRAIARQCRWPVHAQRSRWLGFFRRLLGWCAAAAGLLMALRWTM
jgi:predicted GIY-YIG superfamily endonuclease